MEEAEGSTTSTAVIEEERMEEPDNSSEEFYSCGEDSQSSSSCDEDSEESDNCSEEIFSYGEDSESSSSCDSPWNFPHPPEYYREWDGQYNMEWNQIPYHDLPSIASSSFSLSRSSSTIENLDESIKELSLELKNLRKAKIRIQSKLKEERRKHPLDMNVIDEVKSWLIHVDKSIKQGNRLLSPKFHMKLLPWSKQQQKRDASDKKKVILELMETFLKLKSQAKDLLRAIAPTLIESQLKQLKVQTSYYDLEVIKVATDNFHPRNEIGQDSYYIAYKGVLQDGSIVTVKDFSSMNCSFGDNAFLSEIGLLSTLQHRNIVELFGCCVEGNQLLIIYEFLENGFLEDALFGSSQLTLDWQTRRKISLDIARGLAYLHEEFGRKIVHRDIRAKSILLDKHLDAKISGFGLAILGEDIDEFGPVVGTCGYMPPECMWYRRLTEKAEKTDVYSYGIVLLEIVSGKSSTFRNQKYRPEEFDHLLGWACALKDEGKLLDLVDPSMDSNFSATEVEQMLNLALLCTNPSPSFRPTMTSVVSMIEKGTCVTIPSMESGLWLESFVALSNRNKDSLSEEDDFPISPPMSLTGDSSV